MKKVKISLDNSYILTPSFVMNDTVTALSNMSDYYSKEQGYWVTNATLTQQEEVIYLQDPISGKYLSIDFHKGHNLILSEEKLLFNMEKLSNSLFSIHLTKLEIINNLVYNKIPMQNRTKIYLTAGNPQLPINFRACQFKNDINNISPWKIESLDN